METRDPTTIQNYSINTVFSPIPRWGGIHVLTWKKQWELPGEAVRSGRRKKGLTLHPHLPTFSVSAWHGALGSAHPLNPRDPAHAPSALSDLSIPPSPPPSPGSDSLAGL